MAKGAVAKEQIAKKMAEVFGADWIGERDKKYYLCSIIMNKQLMIMYDKKDYDKSNKITSVKLSKFKSDMCSADCLVE